jgi:predicted DCC family thiol-disulfide oxidoreductase YuxK
MRVLRKMTGSRINSQPFQTLSFENLGTSRELAELSVLYLKQGSVYRGARAIAEFLIDSKTPWLIAGWFIKTPVILSFAELAYDLVAKNRHRLPGGTPECQIEPKG